MALQNRSQSTVLQQPQEDKPLFHEYALQYLAHQRTLRWLPPSAELKKQPVKSLIRSLCYHKAASKPPPKLMLLNRFRHQYLFEVLNLSSTIQHASIQYLILDHSYHTHCNTRFFLSVNTTVIHYYIKQTPLFCFLTMCISLCTQTSKHTPSTPTRLVTAQEHTDKQYVLIFTLPLPSFFLSYAINTC